MTIRVTWVLKTRLIEKIPIIFLKPNFGNCKTIPKMYVLNREHFPSKVRALFLTFPHEKKHFPVVKSDFWVKLLVSLYQGTNETPFLCWLVNMVNPEKCMSFLGPKSQLLALKIRFLPYYPNFGQRLVCSPRRDGSILILGTIFWLFVPESLPFL